jgi:hypothetical protein
MQRMEWHLIEEGFDEYNNSVDAVTVPGIPIKFAISRGTATDSNTIER